MIADLFVLAAICATLLVALATLREKRHGDTTRRNGNRGFRFHTHALQSEARARR